MLQHNFVGHDWEKEEYVNYAKSYFNLSGQ